MLKFTEVSRLQTHTRRSQWIVNFQMVLKLPARLVLSARTTANKMAVYSGTKLGSRRRKQINLVHHHPTFSRVDSLTEEACCAWCYFTLPDSVRGAITHLLGGASEDDPKRLYIARENVMEVAPGDEQRIPRPHLYSHPRSPVNGSIECQSATSGTPSSNQDLREMGTPASAQRGHRRGRAAFGVKSTVLL